MQSFPSLDAAAESRTLAEPQNKIGALSGDQVHRYAEQAANLPRKMGGLILSATELNPRNGENQS